VTPSKRILVVDVEAEICELLRLFLAAYGFQVECATTGAEARLLLRQGPVDLLIADPLMPGERGLSLADEAAGAGAKVILTSGDPEFMEVVDLSPYPSLHKPFRLNEIRDLVLATIALRQPSPSSGTPATERLDCPTS
jgi:DNA-binding response OmpR family regulator